MSLGSLVLRHLTVLALTGKTLAGGEVKSSTLEPINETQNPVPVIAVFTDFARADDDRIEGNDIIGAQLIVTLAIEFACMTKVPTKDQQGFDLSIPETDEGFEVTIDIMHRQALMELQGGSTPWAKLWRDCRMVTRGITVERGASVEKTVKFAARRVELQMQIVADPVPGKDLTSFWTEALAAFDADDRTKQLAVTLRKLAEGDDLPDWRAWQAEIGLTDDGIRAIGVAPFVGAEVESGEGTVSIEIAVEDKSGQQDVMRVDGDGATLTRGAGEPVELEEITGG